MLKPFQSLSRRSALGALACAFGLPRLLAQEHLRFVREFGGKQGLFDISSDGDVMLLHQIAGEMACGDRPNCRETIHRLLVRESSGKLVGKQEFVFSGKFFRWMIAFLPGTHRVIVRGHPAKRTDPSGVWEWNPVSSQFRRLADPPAGFEYAAMIGPSAVAGTLPSGKASRRVVWNLLTGTLSDEDDRTDPLHAAQRLPELAALHVRHALFTSRGQLVVIAGEKDDPHDLPAPPTYLFLYESSTGRLVERARLFGEERLLHRKAILAKVEYDDGQLHHIASLMAVSADGKLLAFSYERDTAPTRLLPGLRQREPKFAVYAIDGLRFLGTASHPKQTVGDEGFASVSPTAGGRLLFHPREPVLYTTARATREWAITLA